jgi:RNA polymerase sigma-70 factor (ECF subfamily)
MLALYYWEELPLEDIAELEGCSPNAAKTRLFRARQRFKERYLALGGEASG